jgi:hypothetical protein
VGHPARANQIQEQIKFKNKSNSRTNQIQEQKQIKDRNKVKTTAKLFAPT